MRVLVVEDNKKLALLLSERLMVRGIDSDVCHALDDAGACLNAGGYDAILLDLGLPDGDGLTWLSTLPRERAPVLVLTARGSLEDRVRGLDNGADDYLVKPADAEEIAARLRAISRRPGHRLDPILTLGTLTFHTAERQLFVNGSPVALGGKEANMIEALLRRPGRVVPREQLEAAVYGPMEAVTPNALEAIASRLRKRLAKACGEDMLHTVRGVGYYLGAGKT